MSHHQKKNHYIPFWVGLFFLFFISQSAVRSSVGVFSSYFMELFHLDNTSFGLLGSMYYVGYVFSQIIWGVFLDRYNPIRVMQWAFLSFCFCLFCFSQSQSFNEIYFWRFLTGIAVGPAHIGTMKIIDLYYLEKRNILIGILSAGGKVGSFLSCLYLSRIFSQAKDWSVYYNMTAIFLLLLYTFFCFLCLEKRKDDILNESSGEINTQSISVFILLFSLYSLVKKLFYHQNSYFDLTFLLVSFLFFSLELKGRKNRVFYSVYLAIVSFYFMQYFFQTDCNCFIYLFSMLFSCLGLSLTESGSDTILLNQTLEKNAQTTDFSILKNYKVILWGLYAGLIYSPIAILVDTWGVKYLSLLSCPKEASAIVSFLLIGSIVGTFALGFLEKKNHNSVILCLTILSFLATFVLLWQEFRNLLILKIILFSVGFFISAQSLVFGKVMDFIKNEQKGLALSYINTLNMITGMLFPPLIGLIMDTIKIHTSLSELKQMSLALGIVPLGILLSGCCLLFLMRIQDQS